MKDKIKNQKKVPKQIVRKNNSIGAEINREKVGTSQTIKIKDVKYVGEKRNYKTNE